jgi:hypothetical protein
MVSELTFVDCIHVMEDFLTKERRLAAPAWLFVAVGEEMMVLNSYLLVPACFFFFVLFVL